MEKQSASRSRHAIMEIVNLRRGVREVSDTNSDQELAPKRAAKLTAKELLNSVEGIISI